MRIRSPPLALSPGPNPNPNSLILIPYIFSQPYRSNPNRLTLPVYHNRLTLTLTLTLINSSPNPNPNQVRIRSPRVRLVVRKVQYSSPSTDLLLASCYLLRSTYCLH